MGLEGLPEVALGVEHQLIRVDTSQLGAAFGPQHLNQVLVDAAECQFCFWLLVAGGRFVDFDQRVVLKFGRLEGQGGAEGENPIDFEIQEHRVGFFGALDCDSVDDQLPVSENSEPICAEKFIADDSEFLIDDCQRLYESLVEEPKLVWFDVALCADDHQDFGSRRVNSDEVEGGVDAQVGGW